MKFTLSWLKDYLHTDTSIEEICDKLTIQGLEVEQIIDRSKDLKEFIVAEILEAIPHPEADRLRVCKVNNGSETLQIVCGAPNARSGIKVVLAPVGSVIPTNGLKIKASKIRNVESNGMLCSATELGVGSDSDGIIELPASAKVGEKYIDVAGLNDPMIEISITPNRGDCLGVYGIARDLAAAGLGTLKPLPNVNFTSNFPSPITVKTFDSNACPLLIGCYIKNVKDRPSPDWLRNRLNSIGEASISALVDVSNYISYCFARPLHIYDADKINGTLSARIAKKGETFQALNDKNYNFEGDEIVIADDQKILGLAGIMGGKHSGCSDDTINIIIESAIFDPILIAKDGRKHAIDSSARYRFERKIDPAFTRQGAYIAAQMIVDICGGEISELSVAGQESFEVRKIALRLARIQSLGGLNIEDSQVVTILNSLGFVTEQASNGVINVTIPSWRQDIEGEADLVEEVIRIYGYDNLPETPLPQYTALPKAAITPMQSRLNTARRLLASRGMDQIVSWSFMSSSKAEFFNAINPELKLLNPISNELDYMRFTIIPNLLDIAKKNIARNFNNLALFEVGPIYRDTSLNGHDTVIAGIRVGKNNQKNIHNDSRLYDFFDVKDDFEAVLADNGMKLNRCILSEDVPSWYHPRRAACVMLGKNLIGYFGELHPLILKKMNIKTNVMAFEIYLNNMPVSSKKLSRKPALNVSDYQAVERDYAFIVNNDVQSEAIIRATVQSNKNLIKEVRIFDIYSGSGVEPGKKSVAITVTLQASDHTLTDQEIEEVSGQIIANVTKQTNAVLRN